MSNYETLLAEKEALTNRLAEIDKSIKSMERAIYRGKMEKAIALLKECNSVLYDVLIFDLYEKCEGCGGIKNIELYLADVVKKEKVEDKYKPVILNAGLISKKSISKMKELEIVPSFQIEDIVEIEPIRQFKTQKACKRCGADQHNRHKQD